MKKQLAMLLCMTALLISCGKDDDNADSQSTQPENAATEQNAGSYDKVLAGDVTSFMKEYESFSDVRKYYFCAAFSMGAMSVSKPATASAMIGYFLGLGVVKYDRGIDDETYYAFDLGKNAFRYEAVVNHILDSKICENIMIDAADYAKSKKYSTEYLSDKGHKEAEKIVEYIKK